MLSKNELQIAIVGTFDLQNYGDLLFPLIAEFELSRRLESIRLHRFSYHKRAATDWPYSVASLTELPELTANLSGLLIGGGQLIRFDKTVADGYFPPTPNIHHPTGYWLAPMMVAMQHGVPIAINSTGANQEVPAWAEPLIKLAINGCDYIAVRDEFTRNHLLRFSPQTEIELVPDTAFGISQLIEPKQVSAELRRLKEWLGLHKPYLIVQAVDGVEDFVQIVKNHPREFSQYQLVIIPIGPALGDDAELLKQNLPGVLSLTHWPPPLLLAELIAGAEAAIGISLHLSITALAFGVPSFRPTQFRHGKYETLSNFPTVFHFSDSSSPDWFTERFGRAEVSAEVIAAQAKLARHWDRIATLFGKTSANNKTKIQLAKFLQTLPVILENHSTATQNWRNQTSNREEEIAMFKHSTSWRLSAPIRLIGRLLKGQD